MNNYYQHSAPCYSFGRKLRDPSKENDVGPGHYNWTAAKDKTLRSNLGSTFPKARNGNRFGMHRSQV